MDVLATRLEGPKKLDAHCEVAITAALTGMHPSSASSEPRRARLRWSARLLQLMLSGRLPIQA